MIREYQDTDYPKLYELYQHGEWFGGQFDKARDGKEKLTKKIKKDPDSIWVYEKDGELLGSISLIDDGRVAWLFRFVVKNNDQQIAKALYDKVIPIFKAKGHTQILAYTPVGDKTMDKRYEGLGMIRGNAYTTYWVDV